MKIGNWTFPNPIFVAPMAGVTDRPYRQLCKKLGAGHAVSEMAASNKLLWDSVKTSRRLDHNGEIAPITVQLAGSDPDMMAEAAVYNIKKGAQIIDINMGCPAKKVCRTASGSALLRDEPLVAKIIKSVVDVCKNYDVPVTLKTRTGWDEHTRNAINIALLAQDLGVAAIALHGRTRCDFYKGQAEYETIRAVKSALEIPVIANGDIDSPEKAKFVLEYTNADALMIGRAAQGRPWIFQQINHYLQYNTKTEPPTYGSLRSILSNHLIDHYAFYGEYTGVRTARKHIGWYLNNVPHASDWMPQINSATSTTMQLKLLDEWLSCLPANEAYIGGDTHKQNNANNHSHKIPA